MDKQYEYIKDSVRFFPWEESAAITYYKIDTKIRWNIRRKLVNQIQDIKILIMEQNTEDISYE